MKTISVLLLFLSGFCISCSKGSDSGSGPGDTTPSNLAVNAVVSTDSSGNVSFTATSTGGVTYDFNFGNYNFQNGVAGNTSYTYPFSGTYNVVVTAKSAGGKTVSKTISVSVAVALHLVWSDEFDTPGSPDPSKWGFDLGTGSNGWGNNELEYYTNRLENAIISNGTLKIVARKESYSGSAYTSARMLSNNLYAFKYGKIEVRAKLPAAAGTWPGIWMLGSNISTAGWPACGEIDIMEQSGTNKSLIYGTMHYPTQVGQYGDGGTTTILSPDTEFHVFTALWTPNSIQMSMDGVPYYTLTNTPGLPFNQTFFIILNLAMGGNFGGTVDAAFSTDLMEIDYVRVYQ